MPYAYDDSSAGSAAESDCFCLQFLAKKQRTRPTRMVEPAIASEKLTLNRKNRQSDRQNTKFEMRLFAPFFNLEKRNQILSDHWGNVECGDAPAWVLQEILAPKVSKHCSISTRRGADFPNIPTLISRTSRPESREHFRFRIPGLKTVSLFGP